jgi:hypothetical protein
MEMKDAASEKADRFGVGGPSVSSAKDLRYLNMILRSPSGDYKKEHSLWIRHDVASVFTFYRQNGTVGLGLNEIALNFA